MRVDGLLRHPRCMAARPVRRRVPHMQVIVEVRVSGGRKLTQPLPSITVKGMASLDNGTLAKVQRHSFARRISSISQGPGCPRTVGCCAGAGDWGSCSIRPLACLISSISRGSASLTVTAVVVCRESTVTWKCGRAFRPGAMPCHECLGRMIGGVALVSRRPSPGPLASQLQRQTA